MKLRTLLAAAALVGAAPVLTAAAPAPSTAAAPVTITASGAHLLGNSKARARLVEYASYTCPHCAEFEDSASVELRADYVSKGLVSFELRNLIRDPVDFTAAMLARCGQPEQFFGNHHFLLRNQNVWLPASRTVSPEARKAWSDGTYTQRMGKIARDTGLFGLMQGRGFTPAQLDACLADEQQQQIVGEMSAKGQELGVKGTPTFFLNGKQLDKVDGWRGLKTLLPKR